MPMIKDKNTGSDEEYQLTESDDSGDENKISLNDVKESESEEEVLNVGDSEEDDDEEEEEEEENELAESDIEGMQSDDDDMPDERAWGKKRKNYYNTDFVDQDFGGWKDDAEDAEREEEEAKKLQQQHMAQLEEEDFDLDMFPKPEEIEMKQLKPEKIERDLTKMSHEEKLALFKKEAPEFEGLLNDFEYYWLELERIAPVFELVKEKKLPESSGLEYIYMKNQILLNYCMNISFYLYLKAKRIPIHGHPIINRLAKCKKMIKDLETKGETVDKQIDFLLKKIQDGTIEEQLKKMHLSKEKVLEEKSNKRKKQLSILSLTNKEKKKLKSKRPVEVEEEEIEEEDEFIVKKKKKLDEEEFNENKITDDFDDDDDDDDGKEMSDNEEEEKGTDKRAITRQIEKNRGLTPHRKKELRNPRVKHRNKYRRALIRRKGMVRQVRKEESKYSGEHSGINPRLSKSIKFQ